MNNAEKLILVFFHLSEFLYIDEVLALMSSSKELRTLFSIVHQASFPNFQRYAPNWLTRIGQLCPNISDLSMCHQGQWDINLASYHRLTMLSVFGGLQYSSDQLVESEVHSKLRCLRVSGLVGRNCQGVYTFLRRFTGLRQLILKRTSPILLNAFAESLVSLALLESVELTECFTDRNQLRLDGLQFLQHIEVSKCMNLTGIFSNHNLDKLKKIRIINCPITTASLIALISVSPALKFVDISQCNGLTGNLSIEQHSSIKSIHISHCSKLTRISIGCPSLSNLEVRMCYALSALSVASAVLDRLDLSQHALLAELELLCPLLSELNVVGCRALGSLVYKSAFKCPDSSAPFRRVTLGRAFAGMSLLHSAEVDHPRGVGLERHQSESESENDSESDTSTSADCSEVSSTLSARLVSSRSVLGASNQLALDHQHSTPAEKLLRRLRAECPRLELREFLRKFIFDTHLAVQREQLYELLHAIDPLHPSAGGCKVDNSPDQNLRKGNRKAYPAAPVKRKSRRAKKGNL